MPKSAIKIFLPVLLSIWSIASATAQESEVILQRSPNFKDYDSQVVKKIPIPKGYHEALLVEGADIWVTNGKGLKTWVVDKASGSMKNELAGVAGFTEGITRMPDGTYMTADWQEKKIYRVRVMENRMFPIAEKSVAPAFPAGVLWNGSRLYVVTWTRGMGTKFNILEMDEKFDVIRRISVPHIQEPAHLAWDGRYIWISSWYSKTAYKINPQNWMIIGQVRSPISRATGIAWDGRYLWLTGTYSDLYQLQVEGY